MNETDWVNVVTVVRAVLVGGILLVIPRITRRGLLFGAYVGEEAADGELARRLNRTWLVGCILLTLVAMIVGLTIGFTGHPVAGNIICLAILLAVAPLLYVKLHRQAREFAPPAAAVQAETAVASLEYREPRETGLAKVALAICIIAGAATVVYAAIHYEALPERIPMAFNASGEPTSWAEKPFVTVMFSPLLNLFLCPFLAVMALLTARAKKSVRGGSGGRSAEAQTEFRAAMANVLSGAALLSSALMTFISVQIIRMGLSQSQSMVAGVMVISIATIVFLGGICSLSWSSSDRVVLSRNRGRRRLL